MSLHLFKKLLVFLMCFSIVHHTLWAYRLAPQNRNKTSQKKTLIQIQDVHLNAEAQQSESNILSELLKSRKVDVVGVEGTWTKLNVSSFRQNIDLQTRKDLADYFLKKGELDATSYVALTYPQSIPPFIGIEDRSSYYKNIAAYKASKKHKAQVKAKLKTSHRFVTKLKKEKFSLHLQFFDNALQAYESNDIKTAHYFKALSKGTHLPHPEIEKYLMHSEFNEKAFKKAVQELAQNTKVFPSIRHLNFQLKNKKISKPHFWKKMTLLARDVNLSSQAIELFELRAILSSPKMIPNSKKLINEIKSIEALAIESLAHNEESLEAAKAWQLANLFSKLSNFTLTPNDWHQLNDLLKFKFRPSISKHFYALYPNLKHQYEFYEWAEKRNRDFLTNIEKHLKGKNTAVVIAGGYHTQGLKRLAEEKGFSFISLTPKIKSIPDQKQATSYLNHFLSPGPSLWRNSLVTGSFLSALKPGHFVSYKRNKYYAKLRQDDSPSPQDSNTHLINGKNLEIIFETDDDPKALITERTKRWLTKLNINPEGTKGKVFVGPLIEWLLYQTIGVVILIPFIASDFYYRPWSLKIILASFILISSLIFSLEHKELKFQKFIAGLYLGFLFYQPFFFDLVDLYSVSHYLISLLHWSVWTSALAAYGVHVIINGREKLGPVLLKRFAPILFIVLSSLVFQTSVRDIGLEGRSTQIKQELVTKENWNKDDLHRAYEAIGIGDNSDLVEPWFKQLQKLSKQNSSKQDQILWQRHGLGIGSFEIRTVEGHVLLVKAVAHDGLAFESYRDSRVLAKTIKSHPNDVIFFSERIVGNKKWENAPFPKDLKMITQSLDEKTTRSWVSTLASKKVIESMIKDNPESENEIYTTAFLHHMDIKIKKRGISKNKHVNIFGFEVVLEALAREYGIPKKEMAEKIFMTMNQDWQKEDKDDVRKRINKWIRALRLRSNKFIWEEEIPAVLKKQGLNQKGEKKIALLYLGASHVDPDTADKERFPQSGFKSLLNFTKGFKKIGKKFDWQEVSQNKFQRFGFWLTFNSLKNGGKTFSLLSPAPSKQKLKRRLKRERELLKKST